MVTVEIKLKSAVSEKRDRLLGVIAIANDGTGTANKGNYNYVLSASRDMANGRGIKKGRVTGYKRKRESPFKLIAM